MMESSTLNPEAPPFVPRQFVPTATQQPTTVQQSQNIQTKPQETQNNQTKVKETQNIQREEELDFYSGNRYQVEYSKSGRATCKTCQSKIGKDEIRIAKFVDMEVGDGWDTFGSRTIPVWFHYNCFFSKNYRNGKGDTKRVWSRFDGKEYLKAEDQKLMYLQITGKEMEEEPVVRQKQVASKKKDAEDKENQSADAVFTDSDPDTIIYSMLNKYIEKMKVADLKECIAENNIDAAKKKKKADLIAAIMEQDLKNIPNLAFQSLNKGLTISSLKAILQNAQQKVSGTKPELIWRLLEARGAGSSSEAGPSPYTNPTPALSAKDMGPDIDLVHEEYPRNIFPKAHIKSYTDIVKIIREQSKPRHVTFDRDLSVKTEELEELLKLCGHDLIVLEMGNSDTGSWVKSSAAKVIADNCPRLQKLSMESCDFTDKDAILVGYSCPRLRFLHISGHNKTSGRLDKKFLQKMKEEKSFLKNLRVLNIIDQNCGFDQLQKLSKSRKQLKIRQGDSGDDRWYMPNFGGDMSTMRGGRFDFDSD